MTVPATPTDNPTLTAEEIGRRFLKLIEGLEARSDLSLDRIKNDTGVALGRFPVPSETLTYYAYSQPLDDGWFFSINYNPASPGLKEGAELIFSNVRNDLAGMQSRSEEPTSELQSIISISYAVFCWKTQQHKYITNTD